MSKRGVRSLDDRGRSLSKAVPPPQPKPQPQVPLVHSFVKPKPKLVEGFGKGLVADVKSKVPHLVSDFTDGASVKVRKPVQLTCLHLVYVVAMYTYEGDCSCASPLFWVRARLPSVASLCCVTLPPTESLLVISGPGWSRYEVWRTQYSLKVGVAHATNIRAAYGNKRCGGTTRKCEPCPAGIIIRRIRSR